MARRAPILWDVVEEHLDEAAFLWTGWERALDSPLFDLAMVAAGPEPRLLAHLDALRVGGRPVARRLLEPALAGDDPGAAFAAAWVLAEDGDGPQVVEALAAAGDAGRPGVRRALEVTGWPGTDEALLAAAGRDALPPPARAAALEALAARGGEVGPVLRAAFAVPDAALRAAALRAARLTRAPWVSSLVLADLASPEGAVRDAALATGLVLGLRDAWSTCRRLAAAEAPTPLVQLLVALGGEAADQEPLLAAARRDRPSRAALYALGFTGRVAAADACLDALEADDPAVARLAGEVFTAVAGLAIEPPYLALQEPEPEEPVPFEADDLAADLAGSAEDDLPRPDPVAVRSWWGRTRPGLDPAGRLLGGQPRTAAAVAAALSGGPMRRRHALALELEIRSRGALRVPTRRWARQQALPAGGLGAVDLGRPFQALAKGV